MNLNFHCFVDEYTFLNTLSIMGSVKYLNKTNFLFEPRLKIHRCASESKTFCTVAVSIWKVQLYQ